MKKILLVWVIFVAIFGMVACRPDQPTHTHTMTGELIIAKEPTCAEEGAKHLICQECGEIVYTVAIPKTNDHTTVTIPAVKSSCISTGLTEGKKCTVCGKILVTQQETPISGHTYYDNYDDSCNKCGHVRDVECIHSETEVIEGKDSTCSEIGYTNGAKCKKCGEILVPQKIVPLKTQHTESDWIIDKKPTETEQGKKHTECIICGTTISEELIPVGTQIASSGLVFTRDVTGYSVVGIGTCRDRDIIIPEVYNGIPITSIGSEAFYYCYTLSSIEIPDSVTSIGASAFANCYSLTNVNFGENSQLVSIGSHAFYDCDWLTSIELPDSVTSIGSGAFSHCSSLASIVIPDLVESISTSTFYGCTSLISVEIPDSVMSIGNFAFYECESLTDIEIPDSVTSIGDHAFSNCYSLANIFIPDTVTNMGYATFQYCFSLTIYCEASSKPNGWRDDWNNSNRPVVWGYKE